MVLDTIHSNLFYVLIIEKNLFNIGTELKLWYFCSFLHCYSKIEHEGHITLWEAALLPGSGLTQNVVHPWRGHTGLIQSWSELMKRRQFDHLMQNQTAIHYTCRAVPTGRTLKVYIF